MLTYPLIHPAILRVLTALAGAIPIEGPYARAEAPPIWSEFRQILTAHGATDPLERLSGSCSTRRAAARTWR